MFQPVNMVKPKINQPSQDKGRRHRGFYVAFSWKMDFITGESCLSITFKEDSNKLTGQMEHSSMWQLKQSSTAVQLP